VKSRQDARLGGGKLRTPACQDEDPHPIPDEIPRPPEGGQSFLLRPVGQ